EVKAMITKQNFAASGALEDYTGELAPLWQLHRRGGEPAGSAVFGHHRGVNAPAHVEFGQNPHESGGRRRYQILQDLVGHRFVECAAVAERPDVEFQRLQLDASQVWHVLELER